MFFQEQQKVEKNAICGKKFEQQWTNNADETGLFLYL